MKFEPLLTDESYAATLLTPSFRKFKFISDENVWKSSLNLAKSFLRQKIVLSQYDQQNEQNKEFIQKKSKLKKTLVRIHLMMKVSMIALMS